MSTIAQLKKSLAIAERQMDFDREFYYAASSRLSKYEKSRTTKIPVPNHVIDDYEACLERWEGSRKVFSIALRARDDEMCRLAGVSNVRWSDAAG